jgi:putative GTP pyrophosphokinase
MFLTDREKIINEAVEWYKQNFHVYENLAKLVDSLVRKILDNEGINYPSITNRAKEIDRYREKASKVKYTDPRSEIMDMAGIRIITYLDSDAKKVERIIKSNFEVIPEFSQDKSDELGPDRFGYNSIHCVCTLGKERATLSEYRKYANLRFEIQIRTILQHAWAAFEHDRGYKKFRDVLPIGIRRRLAMVAGNLELLDWTFESISKEIDQYNSDVKKKTELGDLNTPITSASLRAYLPQKFSKLLEKGIKSNRDEEDDITMANELFDIGIDTFDQLNKIIPNDFVETAIKYNLSTTFLGLIRYLMIINDPETYFQKAWHYSWHYVDSKEAIKLLEHYGVSEKQLKEYLKKRRTPTTL